GGGLWATRRDPVTVWDVGSREVIASSLQEWRSTLPKSAEDSSDSAERDPRTLRGRTLGGNGAVEVMGSQEREGHRQTRAGEWGSCRGGRGRPWFALARDLENHAFSAGGGGARRIQVSSPCSVRELVRRDLGHTVG